MSDEFLVAERTGPVDPDAAALTTVDGPIFLELAVQPLVDVDRVWEPLAELHEAATGGRAHGAADGLTSAESFDSWSRATLGLQGYLRAVSPEAAARVLDSATDYAEFVGRLHGLDSVYLSALASAGRDMNMSWATLERAGTLIDDVGIPHEPGGGTPQALMTHAGTGRAALVDQQSLKQQIESAHGNPVTIVDVLAREGLGVLGSASRSVVPGSGIYVKEIGGVVTSTGEGVAWGASAGAAIGLIGGPPGAAVGAVVGAILGGVIGFVTSLGHAVSTLAGADAAKGDKVPVGPPAPVTDHGHTTHLTKDGHTSAGPVAPTGGTGAGLHGSPPGPSAKHLHCPRDEDGTLALDLAGWSSRFELMGTVAPTGSGFDALFTEAVAITLPLATEVSVTGEVMTTGLWGDLMIRRAAPSRPGVIDLGRLVAVDELARRAHLARALLLRADPDATLAEAIRSLAPLTRTAVRR